MDVGSVDSHGQDAITTLTAQVVELQKSSATLAAMIKNGKGGKGAKNDTARVNPGKGGQGGTPSAPVHPTSPPPSGANRWKDGATTKDGRKVPYDRLRVCKNYAETGRCDRGESCKFPHVQGLPKSLRDKAISAQGLLLGHLGELQPDGDVLKFNPSHEQAALAAIATSGRRAQIGSIEEERDEYDGDFHIGDEAEATLQQLIKGGEPGFQRQR